MISRRMKSSPSGPREFAEPRKAWLYLSSKAVETRAKERREKFANDIQRIRNRKRNETVKQVPFDPEQSKAFFAKLESNKAIWKEIFKNVTNLSDITSAYFANDIFRDHLEEKRMLMLLVPVLGVLRKLCYGTKYYEDILFDHDIFTLRLVSKAWKKAAEEQFQTYEGCPEPDWYLRKDTLTNKMIMTSPFHARFDNANDVELAIDVLRTSQSCALLLKVVEVFLAEDEDEDAMSDIEMTTFISRLGELLDDHGEHVWSLHFVGPFDYQSLRELVSRTPNLKELVLGFWENENETGNDERMMVSQFPFPTISSLRRLTLFNIPEEKILIGEILKKSENLRTASIAEEYPHYLRELYPFMANLRLECFHFSLNKYAVLELPDITPLGNMQWPLKIFDVSWTDVTGRKLIMPCSEIFGILNQFNGTLEEIHVNTVMLASDDQRVVLHFPNLKVVEEDMAIALIRYKKKT